MSNVDFCVCIELTKYQRLDATPYDTVIMPCNTTSSFGVTWTKTDGYFSLVYVNGSIVGYNSTVSRRSVVNASTGDYSLRIHDVQADDSGSYDCYETDGRRIVGYYLMVTRGWLLFGVQIVRRYTPTLKITVCLRIACTRR